MSFNNFCPNCNNLLSLTKSKQSGGFSNAEVIDTILNNESVTVDVDIDSVKNSKEFQDLNKKDKKTIIDNLSKKTSLNSTPIHTCSNCNYTRPINPGHIFYRKMSSSDNYESNTTNYKLLANDPTLPVTRNYTCVNQNCISHKEPTKREAVFISYNDRITYICRLCYYHQNI